FFFQAEDGIRDFHVTGVQTCALPISAAAAGSGASPSVCRHRQARTTLECSHGVLTKATIRTRPSTASGHGDDGPSPDDPPPPARSEERRVGKEWRSRWSAEHKTASTE